MDSNLSMAASVHQQIGNCHVIDDDIPTVHEKRTKTKRERELAPYSS